MKKNSILIKQSDQWTLLLQWKIVYGCHLRKQAWILLHGVSKYDDHISGD